ncbi:MAG: sporulation protein YjcZ [Acidobacteria bacterium]|nr:sporulation protein YjcZ [Acidobacteriota bacterium]
MNFPNFGQAGGGVGAGVGVGVGVGAGVGVGVGATGVPSVPPPQPAATVRRTTTGQAILVPCFAILILIPRRYIVFSPP